MRRLRRFSIANKSDLIYAKIEIAAYLNNPHEKELYSFAVMELGSNILKHSESIGEIWLLERHGFIALAACDRGHGIGNIELALLEGYSTYEHSSLGIGLSSLNKKDGYFLSVVSFTQKELHGTVVFFGPKTPKVQVEWFSLSFDENYNGDFALEKGRLFAFGDAAGHGIKAAETATAVTAFFQHHCHSILTVSDFVDSLHHHLIESNLRSCDLVIGAVDSHRITLSGTGNLNVWEGGEGNFNSHALRSGSIGAHYGKLSNLEFEITAKSPLLITSDGVLKEKFNLLSIMIFISEPIAALCAALYFCGSLSDDASIMLLTSKEMS